METNKKNSNILNDLIKINNDRVQGYDAAIKETKDEDEDLRTSFRKMQSESEDYLDELKSQVTELGGEAATSATLPGEIYRVWMDAKTAIAGKSRHSVLSACEFGEDAAQRAYKTALEAEDLLPGVRTMIAKQQRALKTSHDLIRNWRDREADKPKEKSTAF